MSDPDDSVDRQAAVAGVDSATDAMPTRHGLSIRKAESAELGDFIAYLADQLADNGRNGQPRFQLADASGPVDLNALEAGFSGGMARGILEPGWRRLWIAVDAQGRIGGHIDLRAHAHALASHRCLLGMGVDRGHRRQGLGRTLIEHAVGWATRCQGLDWIDLRALSSNLPAIALYLRAGFQRLGETPDMFRIGDERFGWTRMALFVGSAEQDQSTYATDGPCSGSALEGQAER